jgi:hypothetical protein
LQALKVVGALVGVEVTILVGVGVTVGLHLVRDEHTLSIWALRLVEI